MHHDQNARKPWRCREFIALSILFCVLWLAGGSSRADVSGQIVVRLTAWTCLLMLALSGKLTGRHWNSATGLLLIACCFAAALHLVPLPPDLWTRLPGRTIFIDAAQIAGHAQPWRPLTISPSATWNSLGSLVVPVAVFALASRFDDAQQRLVWQGIFALVMLGCMLAIFQFSGARFDNPLINYVPGTASGNFANRNHFALFVGIGLIALSVGFRGERRLRSHGPLLAWVSICVMSLTVLATGSRSGVGLFALAACTAAVLHFRPGTGRQAGQRRRDRRWLYAVPVILIALAILASVYFGRAVSVERASSMSIEADQRTAALPVLLRMIGAYFPFGSGFGAFDRAFRITEPDSLLQPSYFNHAHNDWLEIVIDGGLLSIGLALAAAIWLVRRIRRLWQDRKRSDGTALALAMIILLTCLASVTDYPARTPMIMALLVLSALALAPPRSEATEKAVNS